jgi:hypothetical protein
VPVIVWWFGDGRVTRRARCVGSIQDRAVPHPSGIRPAVLRSPWRASGKSAHGQK